MTKEPENQLDPFLSEALDKLREVPARDPAAAASGRARFLAEARSLRGAVSPGPFVRLMGWISRIGSKEIVVMNWRMATVGSIGAIAITLTALFGGAAVTAYASQGSLPGDGLYPVKSALEDAQLALALDAAADTELHLLFAEKRLDELEGLIQAGRFDAVSGTAEAFESHVQGALDSLQLVAAVDPARAADLTAMIFESLSRYAQILTEMAASAPEAVQEALRQALSATGAGQVGEDVEFSGFVDEIGELAWIIDGQEVGITPETMIDEGISVGDFVRVEAILNADGSLTAVQI